MGLLQGPMQTALLAWGRGVTPERRWESLSILDVHPTLLLLLGIEAAGELDGNPIAGIEPPPRKSGP